MKDYKNLSRDEFLKLSTEDIVEIISVEGRPKVGVFMPDGSRRSAMFFLGLKPSQDDFENKYIEIEKRKFLENVRIMFEHGLETLIIPTLKHENFDRDERTINAIMNKLCAIPLSLIFACNTK